MSVTINARGTSVPYFTVGKSGVTFYQGSTDPSEIYSIRNGDYWFKTTDLSLNIWSVNAWIAPKLANFDFADSTITSTSSDITLSPGEDKSVIIQGTGAPGHAVMTTDASQDLYIDPSIGGGGKLVLGPVSWPLSDGTSGQVLSTDGSGELSFVNPSATKEWILTASTTSDQTTANFTVRSDSPNQSNEIALSPNSANTIKLTVQGIASDNTNIFSSSAIIVSHQVSTSPPVIDMSTETVYFGGGLCSFTYSGVTVSSAPYLRISLEALSTAATKNMTWSISASISSTVAG